MTDTLVILGGVIFQDYEIPEKIPFGGKHQVTTHKLIGGQRVVDAMGPDDADITWSGKFRGPGALGKAQAIDAMRIAGQQVSLSWLGLFYQVVITDFKAETEKYYEVPYSITCLVVIDPAQNGGASAPSLDALVGADLLSIAGNVALAAITSPIGVAVGKLPSLIGASKTAIGTVASAVVTAQGAITAQAATYDAAIAAAPTYGLAGAVGGQAAAAATMLAQIAALSGEAAAQDSYAYVSRIGVNLATGAV